MAIVAKFDLETVQMDAVNVFVYYYINEVVYIKPPPGFEPPRKVLRLKKALYELRRSPLFVTVMTGNHCANNQKDPYVSTVTYLSNWPYIVCTVTLLW